MTRVRGVRTELGLARTAGLGLGRAMALAGGAFAAGSAVGRVASMETRLARLGIQARQPTEAMTALRERIAEVANAPAIKLDPSELLAAVEAIVEKTGDLKFAEDNLQTLAEAIQGAGSTGDAMGRLAAELRKVGVVETDEVAASLNLVTAQGKTGAFTIGHLARQGERLFSAFARLGATGGPEQAATTIEALIRGLTDAVTLERIADIGVRVRKDDGSYRDLDQILTEIATATGGDAVALSKFFDAESIRVVGQAASKQGADEYKKFLEAEPVGNELATDAAVIAETIAAQEQDVKTEIDNRLFSWFTGPLGTLAQTVAAYKEELFTVAAAGLIGGGAVRGIRGAVRGVRAWRRGGAVGAAAAGSVVDEAAPLILGPDGRPARPLATTMSTPVTGRGIGLMGRLRGAGGRVAAVTARIPGAGLARTVGRRAPLLYTATSGASIVGSLTRGRTGEAAETAAGLGGGLTGGGLGTYLGGLAGGLLSTATGGLAAPILVPAGMFAGGLLGGWLGDKAGRAAVSRVFDDDEPGGQEERLPDAALDAAGELDTLAAQADAAGRALETLRPAPLDRPRPTIDQRVGRIEIGPIVIQSPAENPQAVADAVVDQVATRVRQALADEQRRLTDTLVADPSPEGAF